MIQAIGGRCAWKADEMRRDTDWVLPLDDGERTELREAVARVRSRFAGIEFGKADFPLKRMAERMAHVRREVEEGRGVVLMRGLPVDEWDTTSVDQAYWGLGLHLGTALAQTPRGDLLVRVEDIADKNPLARGYRTTEFLPFHNDQGDVVGLLCVRASKSGGASCIASAAAMHDEILRTRPDLLEVLYGEWFYDVRGEEPPGRKPYYMEPRFSQVNGRLFTQHGRRYVESAQRFPEVPRLTPQQVEAMDLMDALCKSEEFRLDMDFRPGDIQFLNNRVVLHSRTDFVDHDDPARKRLLLRLWLRTPGYAELPAYFKPRFEDMDHWLRHPVTTPAAEPA
ncbi:TauD/TfdA family dioxygenase [Ramlibacter sp.]|uniref:TauD/TfdA family dioxygenase n=1 Tax=Ramlibacter sp. TaxID=1917967 RepID=UPI003D12D7C3